MAKRFLKSEQGLTLMGVVFAIGIILVGLVGILSLLRYVAVVGRVSSDRFIAANLAQEGIEIVRSIRDNNWQVIPPGQWNNGLSTGVFTVEYNDDSLARCAGDDPDACPALKTNGDGFYSYDGASATKYSRRIYIYDETDPSACPADDTVPTDQNFCVFSEVVWQALGNNYSSVMAGRLYNWQ